MMLFLLGLCVLLGFILKKLSVFDLGEMFLSIGCWLIKNPDSVLKAVRVLF
jgi:hypothetical protein